MPSIPRVFWLFCLLFTAQLLLAAQLSISDETDDESEACLCQHWLSECWQLVVQKSSKNALIGAIVGSAMYGTGLGPYQLIYPLCQQDIIIKEKVSLPNGQRRNINPNALQMAVSGMFLGGLLGCITGVVEAACEIRLYGCSSDCNCDSQEPDNPEDETHTDSGPMKSEL